MALEIPTAELDARAAAGLRDTSSSTWIGWLALVTGALLVIGLLSSWFFKRVAEDYSHLLANTSHDLSHIHDIVFHSGVSYANLMELRASDDESRRDSLLQSIARERETNDQLFEELRRTTTHDASLTQLEYIMERRQDYWAASDAIMGADPAEEPLTLDSEKSRKLVATYVDYLRASQLLADQIQAKSLDASNEMLGYVKWLRLLFLGLGLFPVALALVILVMLLFLVRQTPIEADLR